MVEAELIPPIDEPDISVVIPLYNGAPWIIEALESVFTQTYVRIECIVVDDGSSDNGAEVVVAWATARWPQRARSEAGEVPRLRLIKRAHAGLIAAWNAGLAAARAPLVARLDQDDRMPPGRLASQAGLLRELGRAHLVTGTVRYFPREGLSTGYAHYERWLNSLRTHDQFVSELFVECPVAGPSWAAWTDDLRALGGYEPEVYPEDYHLVQRVVAAGWHLVSTGLPALEWRHHNARHSLLSESYSPERFWGMRLRHLPAFLEAHCKGRKVAIWSAGVGGKRLARALLVIADTFGPTWHWLRPSCFVERHPGRIGTTISDIPVVDVAQTNSWCDYYILVAVGAKRRDPQVEEPLRRAGLLPTRDYMLIG